MFGGCSSRWLLLRHLVTFCSWAEAITQASVAKPGTAELFLKATHVSHIQRTHQPVSTSAEGVHRVLQ